MVVHEEKGWTADNRGDHTLVAARALLQGYANNGDPAPALAHMDVLRADASLLIELPSRAGGRRRRERTAADAAGACGPPSSARR